jgi:hypothetical protein
MIIRKDLKKLEAKVWKLRNFLGERAHYDSNPWKYYVDPERLWQLYFLERKYYRLQAKKFKQ